jgi:hypothetical protein
VPNNLDDFGKKARHHDREKASKQRRFSALNLNLLVPCRNFEMMLIPSRYSF